MGNSNSADPVVNLLKKVVDENTNSGVCSELSVVGGSDMLLDEYKITESSVARNIIIKKLAHGISRALSTEPPRENATPDEMIAHLLRIIPNPRLGKSIAARENIQREVCEKMADVVNEGYGNIIDKSLGPVGIIEQISDVINSLSAGIHKEFVVIASSVSIALDNLNTIRDLLDRSYTKLNNSVIRSGDTAAIRKANSLSSIHKIIMDEFTRQINMLSNLTHSVLRPVDSDIVKILKNNKDFEGLVARIKNTVGTSEWGDRIGFWLSGLGGVAQMAFRVDKALKDIGMSISSYKESRNFEDLIMNVHNALESVPRSNLTKEYLEKYTDAINTLKKFHNSHDVIADHLTKLEEPKIGGVMPLTKKLDSQLKTRIVLLDDFKMKSNIYMSRIYNAVLRISKALHKGKLFITPELTHFKNLFKDLSNVFAEGSEYALTGYYTHANAVTHKERFLDILNALLVHTNQMAVENVGFEELGRNIGDLLKLIDFYNEKFHVHTSNVATTKTGGGTIYKSIATLKTAKDMFINAYSVSKMRDNLKYASKNREDYNKKYNEIVGTSIAQVIDDYNKKTEKQISDIKAEQQAEFTAASAVGHALHNSSIGKLPDEWTRDAVISKLEYERENKIALFRYCQVIDRELLEYSDEVAKNPNLIREISKMLESVDIVSNWFNDEKGNLLATYFEILSPYATGVVTLDVREQLYGKGTEIKDIKTNLTNGEHYYSYLNRSTINRLRRREREAAAGGPILLGPENTEIGVLTNNIALYDPATYAETPARELLGLHFSKHIRDKSYALKNIISIYTSLCCNKNSEYTPKSLYNALSATYGGSVIKAKNPVNSARIKQLRRLNAVKGGGVQEDTALIKQFTDLKNAPNQNEMAALTDILTDYQTQLKNATHMKNYEHHVSGYTTGDTPHQNKLGHLYSSQKEIAKRLNVGAFGESTWDMFKTVHVPIDKIDDPDYHKFTSGKNKSDDNDVFTALMGSYTDKVKKIMDDKYIKTNMEEHYKKLYKDVETVIVDSKQEMIYKQDSINVQHDVLPVLALQHLKVDGKGDDSVNFIFATLYKIACNASAVLLNRDKNTGDSWIIENLIIDIKLDLEDARVYDIYDHAGVSQELKNLEQQIYLQLHPEIKHVVACVGLFHNIFGASNEKELKEFFTNIKKEFKKIEIFTTKYFPKINDSIKITAFNKKRLLKQSLISVTDLLLLFKLFTIYTNSNMKNKSNTRYETKFVCWSLLDIASRINIEMDIIEKVVKLENIGDNVLLMSNCTNFATAAVLGNHVVDTVVDTELSKAITEVNNQVKRNIERKKKYSIKSVISINKTQQKKIPMSQISVYAPSDENIILNYTKPSVVTNQGATLIATHVDNEKKAIQKTVGGTYMEEEMYNFNEYIDKSDSYSDSDSDSVSDLDSNPDSNLESHYNDKHTVGGAAQEIYNIGKTELVSRKVDAPVNNTFIDNIEIHITKAMVAKILSAAGLYNMLQYNKSFTLNHKTPLDPVRLILGGDPYSEIPDIYPEAMSLYIRLPLLVEFYRDLFCFESQCVGEDVDPDNAIDPYLISMVPEVGSLWSELIQTIFEQPVVTSQTGSYSDNTVKRIIHNINRIYQSFKTEYTKPDIIVHIIENFVSEINNRYGVMRRSEIVKYIQDKNNRDNSMSFNTNNENTYGYYIQPANTSYVVPSDRYSSTVTSFNTRDETYELYKAVSAFLSRIETRMANISRPSIDIEKISLLAVDSLKKSADRETRFKETKSAMFDMERHSHSRADINIMFHETIMAPLALLTKITRMLARFVNIIQLRDIKAIKLIASRTSIETLLNNNPMPTDVEIKLLKIKIWYFVGHSLLRHHVGALVAIGGQAAPYIPALPSGHVYPINGNAVAGPPIARFLNTLPAPAAIDAEITHIDTHATGVEIYRNLVAMIDTNSTITDGIFKLEMLLPQFTNVTVGNVTQQSTFIQDNLAAAAVPLRDYAQTLHMHIYTEIIDKMNKIGKHNKVQRFFNIKEEEYKTYVRQSDLTTAVYNDMSNASFSVALTNKITRNAAYAIDGSKHTNLQVTAANISNGMSYEHLGFYGDDSSTPMTVFDYNTYNILNSSKIFEETTRAILNVNNDLGSLCSIQSSIDGHINIDFSGLHRVCNEVFAGIKKYYSLFRNKIDGSVMNYMDRSYDKVGSIAWVQYNMFDGLFGKSVSYKNMSLGHVNTIINNNIQELSNKKKIKSYPDGMINSAIPNSIRLNDLLLRYGSFHNNWPAQQANIIADWNAGVAVHDAAIADANRLLRYNEIMWYFKRSFVNTENFNATSGLAAVHPTAVAWGPVMAAWVAAVAGGSLNLMGNIINPYTTLSTAAAFDHTVMARRHFYLMLTTILLNSNTPVGYITYFIKILFNLFDGYNNPMMDRITSKIQDEVNIYNSSTGFINMPNIFNGLTLAMQKSLFNKTDMGININSGMYSLLYNNQLNDITTTESTNALPYSELLKDPGANRALAFTDTWRARLTLYNNPKIPSTGSLIGFKNAANENTGYGIVGRFNELVSQYIGKFWDTSVNKIYAPLIETVANGPLRDTVFRKHGYMDIAKSYWKTSDATLATIAANVFAAGAIVFEWHLNVAGLGAVPTPTAQSILGPLYSIADTRKPHPCDIVILATLFCPDATFGVIPNADVEWQEHLLYTTGFLNNTNPVFVGHNLNTANEFWKTVVFMYAYMKTYSILIDYGEYCRRFQTLSGILGEITTFISSTRSAYMIDLEINFKKYVHFMSQHALTVAPCLICYENIIDSLNFRAAITALTTRINNIVNIITNNAASPLDTAYLIAAQLKILLGSAIHGAIPVATLHLYAVFDLEFVNIYSHLNTYNGNPAPDIIAAWHAGGVPLINQMPLLIHHLSTVTLVIANNETEMYTADVPVQNIYTSHILYSTLSKSMYTALTYIDNKNSKPFIIQSLSEIPLRIKEEMKAYLPIFNNLFKSFVKNASFLKHLVKLMPENCFENDHSTLTCRGFTYEVYIQLADVHNEILEYYSSNGLNQKDKYTKVLDKLINSCTAFVSSIENVISDLNDTPLYMEISDNSMLKYKNRNNQIPFTPLSSLLIACKENILNSGFGAFSYGTGENNFMFTYGIRGLIHDYNTIPVFDRMPGVKHIMDNYNITSADYSVIEAKTYEYYIKNIISLFRFVYSTNIYSFICGGSTYISGADPRNEYVEYYNNTNMYLPYQMYDTVPIGEIVSLSTSEDYTKSSGYINDAVDTGAQRNNTRYGIALHNIADLEICPIDLHAMRREVPLINIMNYSHACDRIVKDIVNKGLSTNGITHQTNTAAGMFLKLCKDPYAIISRTEYDTNFVNMVNGNDPPLGKSRYLSNQLLNKVLMQRTNANGLVDYKGKEYAIDAALLPLLQNVGFGRFNTKIIRDDIFHVLLHKTVLYAMNKELTNVMFPVSNGSSVVSEYIINEQPDDDIAFMDI